MLLRSLRREGAEKGGEYVTQDHNEGTWMRLPFFQAFHRAAVVATTFHEQMYKWIEEAGSKLALGMGAAGIHAAVRLVSGWDFSLL